MNLNERIKFLMKKNNIKNILELSKKSNIPYTTLRSIILEDVSKIRVDTASALATFFGVSLDYLVGTTTIQNPKFFLETYLKELHLTSSEYDLIFNEIIDNNRIKLPNFTDVSINDKINSAFAQIFNVYMNYLESNPLSSNIDTSDKEIFDKLNEHIEPIDEKFINMLKTLDREKIIQKNDSNVSTTTDVPRKYPVLGKISAGLPLLAVENIEDYSYAPSSKIQEGYNYFFLRVQRR